MSDEDDLNKVSTPRENGARSMTELSPYNVTYGYPAADAPGLGGDWMGPLQPMHPVAPPEVAGRQFDYPVGYNLNVTPRPYEVFDFRALRNLADSYDPLRIILERRKDQLCRVPWQIRIRHDGDGRRPKAAQLSPQMRGTIKDVTQFFKFPSNGLSFRSFLRMLLLLVLDAPSIYCERDAAGTLTALAPVDGGLIRPVIGDDGRPPRPMRWTGEPFLWNGSEVNTQNYLAIGCKIVGSVLYVPAHAQTLRGLPAVNYTTWDLLYRPLNLRTNSVFGRSPVEQVAVTVSTAMRRSLSQLEYFKEGNQPDAIHTLPETWTPDQTMRFQDYWDNLFSGNLGNRRRMKFIPGGSGSRYNATKEPPLKNEFDEFLIRIVCAALSYPPSAFVSLSNRSIAESHERQAEEEGTEPLKAWFCELANEIICKEFSDEIEFAWLEEEVVDQKVQAEVISTYVQNGILTINQAREKIGEEPDPNPAANTLMAMTPSGFVVVGKPIETPTKEKTP